MSVMVCSWCFSIPLVLPAPALHPAGELNRNARVVLCITSTEGDWCLGFVLLPGAGAGEQLLVYDFPLHFGVTGCAQHGAGLLFVK